ncbi:MAG TPA: cell division protein FtsL [Lachnospiraceae bacterium]|nr:cell division protein FtsL [Lachnospiraceae bacterium]
MTERRRRQQRYVYTATAEEFIREMNSKPRILSKETRHNREKAKHMNIGYVSFLVAALFLCAMILINYIQSQAELTAKISEISQLEKELNTIKRCNDEEIKRLESSTDLEEIKRRAISELGMDYANENQIIIYQSPDQDYMRKTE